MGFNLRQRINKILLQQQLRAQGSAKGGNQAPRAFVPSSLPGAGRPLRHSVRNLRAGSSVDRPGRVKNPTWVGILWGLPAYLCLFALCALFINTHHGSQINGYLPMAAFLCAVTIGMRAAKISKRRQQRRVAANDGG